VERPSVAAVTASGISYQFSTEMGNGPVKINFTVSSYFYPDQSWYQPKLVDSIILGHEQLHFDISEVFARKMRQLLEEARFSKNVKNEVKEIYQAILRELNQFQNQYDRETNFSRNREQQILWNRNIKQLLATN
jgi:hypothetical protein